jgi:uncharacterized protein (TIGR00730 family)
MENICVFGAGSENVDKAFFGEAYSLGKYIAQNGYGLVFGGGNTGLMGQVARGAYDNHAAEIIGIAPEFMNAPGVLYKNCSQLILTCSMHERKQAMESMADVFVVLPGGVGTYEEFFEVLTLKILGLHKKAIILMNTSRFFDPVIHLLEETAKKHFMAEDSLSAVEVADTPKQVIECLDNYEYKEIAPKWLNWIPEKPQDF